MLIEVFLACEDKFGGVRLHHLSHGFQNITIFVQFTCNIIDYVSIPCGRHGSQYQRVECVYNCI